MGWMECTHQSFSPFSPLSGGSSLGSPFLPGSPPTRVPPLLFDLSVQEWCHFPVTATRNTASQTGLPSHPSIAFIPSFPMLRFLPGV